jgi:hypothetical protein
MIIAEAKPQDLTAITMSKCIGTIGLFRKPMSLMACVHVLVEECPETGLVYRIVFNTQKTSVIRAISMDMIDRI